VPDTAGSCKRRTLGSNFGELEAVIHKNVADALAENTGAGDSVAPLVDGNHVAGATIIAEQSIVLAGQPWVDQLFARLDDSIVIDWYIGDGETAETGDVICKLVGQAEALRRGERTALEFLRTLSAIATTVARHITARDSGTARSLNASEALQHLNRAQQYAVRCGGGEDYLIGLQTPGITPVDIAMVFRID